MIKVTIKFEIIMLAVASSVEEPADSIEAASASEGICRGINAVNVKFLGRLRPSESVYFSKFTIMLIFSGCTF